MKVLPYNFTPVYIPGKQNVTPDTLSRGFLESKATLSNPISIQNVTNVGTGYAETFGPPSWVARPVRGVAAMVEEDAPTTKREEGWIAGVVMAKLAEVAELEIAVARTHKGGGVRAITWSVLREETANSLICHKLLQLIGAGMPDRKEDWPPELQQYHNYKNQLLVIDGVVVCGERPLIPVSLRAQALDILHAGHAGTSMMQSRSAHSLFWPGISKAIEERRAMC